MRIVIRYNTIQVIIPNVCNKIENPRCSSSCKIFDTNFLMHYIGVRDGKKEKRRHNTFQYHAFSFTQYISSLYMCIQNLKTSTLTGAEKHL